jgi:quinoprotein glucose dehydrogenase
MTRFTVTVLLVMLAAPATAQPAPGEWTAYGRDGGGSRFSPLTQIDTQNVSRLEVAWVHRTGDLLADRGRFQSTPLMVDGRLYVTTPLGRVNALDPATGAELWTYDPAVPLDGGYGDFANRGASTWLDTTRHADAVCRRRILVATIDARLIALDAAAGTPCADFGEDGTVQLSAGIDPAPSFGGEYQVTSPPAVIGDVVIVGSAIADNQRTDAASGVVRAFDARTGRLRWSWDPIPRSAADPAWPTWRDGSGARTGAANVWSVIAVDAGRDLVFLPTGSPSPDFYGGERRGDNLYANSLVALRASTGERVWHYQFVHHDIWDYDVASPPALLTIRREGVDIPAVAQATKMGLLFLLHRETGEPLFTVEERAVPPSDVPGEEAAPTQPFPVLPLPLTPHRIDAADAFGLTDQDRERCHARLASVRNEGIYTPPSLRGTLIYPGNIGGSNWGGVAIDEARGIIVGATNRVPFVVRLVPRDSLAAARAAGVEVSPQRGTPYGMARDVPMGRPGVPCGPPPWGALSAVSAATGDRLWEVPLGFVPALVEHVPEARAWGSINLGGPIVTAGGLVLIAGTADAHLRAFDTATGRELWAGALPAAGISTPMTYETGGRQFIVIAAGGHDRMPYGPLGDHLVAFALPDAGAPSSTPPPVTAAAFTGRWRGDARIGGDRHASVLVLHAEGDRVHGTLRIDGADMDARLEGAVRSGRLEYRIAFSIPTVCRGTMTGTADLANGGTLLVGPLHVTSDCSAAGEDPGAMGFRREVVGGSGR